MKKLLIWDIDGTLIRCQGVGRISLTKAFKEVYNINDALEGINLSGTVDNEMFNLVFGKYSLPIDALDDFKIHYGKILRIEMHMVEGIEVHKGVINLLECLSDKNQFINMIGTGNCKIGSDEKLKALGLFDYFDLGSYGDEVENRNQLIENAISKAEEHYGHKFLQSNIFVIGDTPGDIISAKHNDVKSISVTTGYHSKDELLGFEPDYITDGLHEIEEFMSFILSE